VSISDLPIQMEGTDYLIHRWEIWEYTKEVKGKIWLFQRNWFEFYDFKLWRKEITGYLQNLKFQKTDSDSYDINW
jgi:hypothetical protein